ncbi:CDPK-related kinase 1 [Acorus calamus]|uniref:CDPK-related kinase 1 n=1 Tax=Acorus calamus TaxID=4465 RepID=A0AAV9CTF8_ACOCL|nr:CDPK-related kinase 1 [Acorus calamus]
MTTSQLYYLQEQSKLLGPNKNGFITLQNFKMALSKNSTEAMKDSSVLDFVNMVSSLQYRKLDFEEFAVAAISVHQMEVQDGWEQHARCAAISVHQMEVQDGWEQHARCAYELFERNAIRPILIEVLASELGLGPSVSVHVVLQDSDGKLSFLGFVRLLHGVSSRMA